MKPTPLPHICPPWFAPVLNNPLRRWLHNADELFGALVAPGFTVVELGCGSGPFTVKLARMVGPLGRVIAADVQPAMLAQVRKRAARAGVEDRVELHLCGLANIGLSVRVDFALAFWMVHEVPDPASFFGEVYNALNAGGRLLVVEPRIHVGGKMFEREVEAAQDARFVLLTRPVVRLSRAVLFGK